MALFIKHYIDMMVKQVLKNCNFYVTLRMHLFPMTKED